MSRHDAAAADAAFAQLYKDGWQPLMVLPPPEPKRKVRARMAEAIRNLMSSAGNVTEGDLKAHGFTAEQIAEHGDDAGRIANIGRMMS